MWHIVDEGVRRLGEFGKSKGLFFFPGGPESALRLNAAGLCTLMLTDAVNLQQEMCPQDSSGPSQRRETLKVAAPSTVGVSSACTGMVTSSSLPGSRKTP